MTTQQELQDKINELQKQLDELKKKPQCKRWRAEEGEEGGGYWLIDSITEVGLIVKSDDNYSDWDNWTYKTGNYFKTKEEAQAYRDYLEARYVIECDADGYEWTYQESNYYGQYDFNYAKLSYTTLHCHFAPGIIYFKSLEAIEKSQEDHPEEWMTYLTYGMPRSCDED